MRFSQLGFWWKHSSWLRDSHLFAMSSDGRERENFDVFPSSYKGVNPIGLGSLLMTSFNFCNILTRLYLQMQLYKGLGLQHMNLKETIQSKTPSFFNLLSHQTTLQCTNCFNPNRYFFSCYTLNNRTCWLTEYIFSCPESIHIPHSHCLYCNLKSLYCTVTLDLL